MLAVWARARGVVVEIDDGQMNVKMFRNSSVRLEDPTGETKAGVRGYFLWRERR